MYLEMSKYESHGGTGWDFGTCLWSPTRKTNRTKWAYWENIKKINLDDIIIHMRDINSIPQIVGLSKAASSYYITDERPKYLGDWEYASEFYRLDLKGFKSLENPIILKSLFKVKDQEFRKYFETNKVKTFDKRRLFYVMQNNTLRRLNGAYLSEVDNNLYNLLFGQYTFEIDHIDYVSESVSAYITLKEINIRVGQRQFSENVKKNFHNECCFPECKINDKNFLIGAHIERWVDSEKQRGTIENGLCLCPFHDRAFELGYYSLNNNLEIIVNKVKRKDNDNYIFSELFKCENKKIKTSKIPLSKVSLKAHRIRAGIDKMD